MRHTCLKTSKQFQFSGFSTSGYTSIVFDQLHESSELRCFDALPSNHRNVDNVLYSDKPRCTRRMHVKRSYLMCLLWNYNTFNCDGLTNVRDTWTRSYTMLQILLTSTLSLFKIVSINGACGPCMVWLVAINNLPYKTPTAVFLLASFKFASIGTKKPWSSFRTFS